MRRNHTPRPGTRLARGARLARRLARHPKRTVADLLPQARANGKQTAPVRDDRPDVFLDVPDLHVDEIDLELDDLQARIALGAHVLELLQLDVGADAHLGRVNLTIKGVKAQAQLQVRLDNVARIVDRVMTTLDRNPELLEGLAKGLGTTAGELARPVGRAVGELAESTSERIEGDRKPARARRPEAAARPKNGVRRTAAKSEDGPRRRPASAARRKDGVRR